MRPARDSTCCSGGTRPDEAGREVIDIATGTIPPADAPNPVRILPHWDTNLLKLPFSVGTVLVRGMVAGAWTYREGRIIFATASGSRLLKLEDVLLILLAATGVGADQLDHHRARLTT